MYKEVASAIEKADSIVIAGHIRPDGDCYGSQLGLKEVILATFPNKKVYCVGTGFPIFHEFIGGMDNITDEVIKNSLCVIVDLNEMYRVEDTRIPKLATNMAQIDHHVVMNDFEFPTLVDEDACSTCELIVRLVQHSNWKMSEKAANALYLGMLTDSAHFEYVSNFPRVFKICSFLCEQGARPEKINQILAVTSERYLRVRGYAYSNYKKRDGVIYLHLTSKELNELRIPSSYGTAVVNSLGNVIGYPIWVTFFEDEKHTCIIEFRSNTYNVCKIAIKYGGGGHMMAAGVTIKGFNKKILNNILDDLVLLTKEDVK